MGTLHHLDVGCADASVIDTGSAVFLVDCHDIARYSYLLPRSKRLRGVFVTHQHSDHYSGLAYLRNRGYSIDYLIYSPYRRRTDQADNGDNSVTKEEWDEFNSHKSYLERKGTETRAPYRQDSFNKAWWATDGATFWILGPERGVANSTGRHIHDASLVIKADLGRRHCLFTGDASDANLEKVRTINHICDDILHASHHGSIEGADLEFINRCNAEYTVISTKSGVHDNVPHPTALRRYRENTRVSVYRTDEDGTQKWTF